LWTGIVLTANFIVITAMQANSRSFFAFSRDGGLPDKGLLSRLDKRKVPVAGVVAVVVLSMLLGLLQFASATALNASKSYNTRGESR
jgi:amino acid transporter